MRLALALLLATCLAACGRASGPEVKDVWARDTVGGTANAAVHMTIASPRADRLVGASAPIARKTDLMTMDSSGGAMRMIYVDAIDLPADKPVSLDPAGLHVWLEGLKEPLKAGQTIPLILQFENAGELRVDVSIIGPAAAPPS